MPNTREKLIELLKEADRNEFEEQRKNGTYSVEEGWKLIADHLIANGVTIQGEPLTNCQQWIPVTERLPENDYGKHWKERARYNVLVNGVVATATFGYRNRDWWVDYRGYVFDKEHYNEVTHWQLAPEPPKEVKPFHYEKGNQPHGAEQFAKACAVCVNNGSTLCKDCKTEKKSGFEPPF